MMKTTQKIFFPKAFQKARNQPAKKDVNLSRDMLTHEDLQASPEAHRLSQV